MLRKDDIWRDFANGGRREERSQPIASIASLMHTQGRNATLWYIYTFVSVLYINDLRLVQIRRHCSLMDMASVYETGGCRFEPCLCQSAPNFFCVR